MTDLSTTGLRESHHFWAGGITGSTSGAEDPRSFADIVLERIGFQITTADGNRRPFGGGTMRSTVEPFGARGLLGGIAPVDAADGGELSMRGTTGDGEHHQPTRDATPAVALPPVRPPAADSDAATLASGSSGARGSCRQENGQIATTVALPESLLSAETRALAAREPGKIGSLSFAGQSFPSIDPDRQVSASVRPLPRLANSDQSASALKVAIDVGEAGVAVSVVGEPLDPDDEEKLHDAVARLLVRHGLVLSDLRVTRRLSPEGSLKGDG